MRLSPAQRGERRSTYSFNTRQTSRVRCVTQCYCSPTFSPSPLPSSQLPIHPLAVHRPAYLPIHPSSHLPIYPSTYTLNYIPTPSIQLPLHPLPTHSLTTHLPSHLPIHPPTYCLSPPLPSHPSLHLTTHPSSHSPSHPPIHPPLQCKCLTIFFFIVRCGPDIKLLVVEASILKTSITNKHIANYTTR